MLEIIKARFSEHMELHPDLEWPELESRLREDPKAVEVLQRMEKSGGEPDTIGYDTVFTFHNGADSYYSVRGFRGYILV